MKDYQPVRPEQLIHTSRGTPGGEDASTTTTTKTEQIQAILEAQGLFE